MTLRDSLPRPGPSSPAPTAGRPTRCSPADRVVHRSATARPRHGEHTLDASRAPRDFCVHYRYCSADGVDDGRTQVQTTLDTLDATSAPSYDAHRQPLRLPRAPSSPTPPQFARRHRQPQFVEGSRRVPRRRLRQRQRLYQYLGYCAPRRRRAEHSRTGVRRHSACSTTTTSTLAVRHRTDRRRSGSRAAHEFVHAIQFAYDVDEDIWFMEGVGDLELEDAGLRLDQRQLPVPLSTARSATPVDRPTTASTSRTATAPSCSSSTSRNGCADRNVDARQGSGHYARRPRQYAHGDLAPGDPRRDGRPQAPTGRTCSRHVSPSLEHALRAGSYSERGTNRHPRALYDDERRLTAEPRRPHVPTLSDFTATTITGEEQPLETYAGKVALVVNTASQCGFTPQFEGLEKLHREYADQGLVVLGFPCNQFGNQDPGEQRGDRRLLREELRRQLPDVREGRRQRRRRPPAVRSGCARRRAACSATRSSGTSPSSWSVATAP